MAENDDLDVVQHPTLGELKFPKDMPTEERNESIQRTLLSRPDVQAPPVVPRPTAPGLLNPAIPSYEQASREAQDAVGKSAALGIGGGGIQEISELPIVGQAVRTAGKVAANQALDRPLKAISKIPEYWQESSPEGQLLQDTKQAVRERRASMIPTRSKGIIEAAKGAEPESGVSLIPEPRQAFQGENPGYMASVPRAELERLAAARKLGAGQQLQQLGKPVIYIP